MSDSEDIKPHVKPGFDSLEVKSPLHEFPTILSDNLSNFEGVDCILGIDESGRGPVLGPMLYSIGIVPINKQQLLKELGVADSKTLDQSKRESIFAQIKDQSTEIGKNIGYIVQILSARHISCGMFRRCKYSLNALSHDSAAHLIKSCIQAKINVKEIYVDTVGKEEFYEKFLSDKFPGISITVSKKADSRFPIVSAASICAKVIRDEIIHNWKNEEPGLEIPKDGFGSGYPADPATKKFMDNNLDRVFGYSSLVRFSWSTAPIILQKKAAKVVWEDEESCESKGTRKIDSMFAKKNEAQKIQRHTFFVERQLSSVVKF